MDRFSCEVCGVVNNALASAAQISFYRYDLQCRCAGITTGVLACKRSQHSCVQISGGPARAAEVVELHRMR